MPVWLANISGASRTTPPVPAKLMAPVPRVRASATSSAGVLAAKLRAAQSTSGVRVAMVKKVKSAMVSKGKR